MNRCRFFAIVAILSLFFLYGCGGPPSAIEQIRTALKGAPTYSIILDDMKEEGNFFTSYYHKYRIIMEDRSTDTGWVEVSKEEYNRYLPFLGMTIWVKKEGKDGESIGPPGYEYVGNPKYGSWQRDSSGNSFWVFYGQYRLISDLLGGGPIYRNHYRDYNTYRSQGRPYYGSKKQYGTNGSITKRQKPNFYSRRMSQANLKKASFSDRVNKRIGRTRTAVRGRSRGTGK